MKISKYTFIERKEDCSVLYNCSNEKLTLIENKLADLLSDHDTDKLKRLHPSFYQYLVENRYLIPSNEKEEDRIIEAWKKEDNDYSQLTISINPTMDCNLRCWYCYEKHEQGSTMPKNVMESVLKLIREKVITPEFRHLHLSFFGGEPLLKMEEIMYPLLIKASELCAIHQKSFSFSMVTNGTLLSPENIERLKEIKTNVDTWLQITLDGNQNSHDLVRRSPEMPQSYQVIIQNIRTAISNGFRITLRLNTTHENIETFIDLLDDFNNLDEKLKELLTIDIQHVWQDRNQAYADFDKKQEALRTMFRQNGFRVTEMKHIDRSRCYADKNNHISVNYNGDLFKCTARRFSKENREGVLLPSGKLAWNHKRELREELKYGNAICKECLIFPLCHGGCSQFKMDSVGHTGCIRGYTEEYKKKIIRDRIEFLLEQFV